MNEILGVSIQFDVVNSEYLHNKQVKIGDKVVRIGLSISD